MNLLLVAPDELVDGVCTLADRRAQHLREVVGARVGDRLRAGILGGDVGRAEVLADDGAAMVVRVVPEGPGPAPLPIDLVLAVPRPKVLTRVIETCATFGVRRIWLTNAWRVDKSYLRSPRLAPDALAHAARLGAEQGGTTHLPAIELHPRLMALLDERFPAASARADAPPADVRLLAHPGAPFIEGAVPRDAGAPVVLAIGPEGGWIPREVETFVARGFAPVSLGGPILRVETAVAAALGQLLLLRR